MQRLRIRSFFLALSKSKKSSHAISCSLTFYTLIKDSLRYIRFLKHLVTFSPSSFRSASPTSMSRLMESFTRNKREDRQLRIYNQQFTSGTCVSVTGNIPRQKSRLKTGKERFVTPQRFSVSGLTLKLCVLYFF